MSEEKLLQIDSEIGEGLRGTLTVYRHKFWNGIAFISTRDVTGRTNSIGLSKNECALLIGALAKAMEE